MNDSHFHYVDPSLPKGRGEGQKDAPDNLTEQLVARCDCEHCIETGQGERRKRSGRETAEIKALRTELESKDAEIAALRARIEGRVDVGPLAGSRRDPDEEEWQRREREEDEERERKRQEAAAAAAARGKKEK